MNECALEVLHKTCMLDCVEVLMNLPNNLRLVLMRWLSE